MRVLLKYGLPGEKRSAVGVKLEDLLNVGFRLFVTLGFQLLKKRFFSSLVLALTSPVHNKCSIHNEFMNYGFGLCHIALQNIFKVKLAGHKLKHLQK